MFEILKLGSKGPEVKQLQINLNRLGLNAGTPDGVFGINTQKALKQFQIALGIKPDGILGPWIKEMLDKKTKNKVVVLTAGHSNTDPGAVNGKRTEAQIAVEIRDGVSSILRSKGYTVINDGKERDNQSLNEAVKLIPKGILAVEVHLNASDNKLAGGIEALAKDKDKDKLFCKNLCYNLSQVFGNKVRGSDGGWKPENSGQHSRLAYVSAGGIILETFFISNDKELKTYDDNKSLVYAVIAKTIEDHI